LKTARILVSGKVQGVFYRVSAKRAADDRGVTGWVKNLKDNQVELIVEGDYSKLLKLIEWCKQGPPGACVTSVEVEWAGVTQYFSEFQIR